MSTSSARTAGSQPMLLVLGVAAAAAAAATVTFLWYQYTSKSTVKAKQKSVEVEDEDESSDNDRTSRSIDLAGGTTKSSKARPSTPPFEKVEGVIGKTENDIPRMDNKKQSQQTNKKYQQEIEKVLHEKIEELDKTGKALFKNKEYLEAAGTFTEALDLLTANEEAASSSSLLRQKITLLNNRSAMYEKGDMPELALEDCHAILELDPPHQKARARKLRILEGMKRWSEALVEVCASQLLFMHANRTNLRMGLPVPPPPIPQNKLEEILNQVLPSEVDNYVKKSEALSSRPLPSTYTILQLLKSYTGYNAWMAQAAKDGSVDAISANLPAPELTDPGLIATRAGLLMRRGRRHVYDRHYDMAGEDFEAANALVDGNEEMQGLMEGDDYARLLEWTGMARHWKYDFDGAMKCYQLCSEIEPTNALILVKEAGVQMDCGKHDEALKLFDTALGMDPQNADALLHRANLRSLQGNIDGARDDLEQCLKLRPAHTMARLRLASILAMQDMSAAKRHLDRAEQAEPNSSEVHSYRGEMSFAQQNFDEARRHFEKAMALEPSNPTPYVNAAMVVINTPPQMGQMPDAKECIRLLEKGIEVDPQFVPAYIQLGQLKLGTATDLDAARDVVALYDRGLDNCRSPEEIRELCSMRTLAVAQIDAAAMLKMNSFSVQ